jgi:isocitrate dehydrogenase
MLRTASRISRVAMQPRASMAARTMSSKPTIIYTETDEAPNLATYSLLPVIKKMVSLAGIDVVKSDISLSGRIICQFPELLTEEQRINDELSALGKYL